MPLNLIRSPDRITVSRTFSLIGPVAQLTSRTQRKLIVARIMVLWRFVSYHHNSDEKEKASMIPWLMSLSLSLHVLSLTFCLSKIPWEKFFFCSFGTDPVASLYQMIPFRFIFYMLECLCKLFKQVRWKVFVINLNKFIDGT